MREIKFRAWDGNQMIHLQNGYWNNEYSSLSFECMENSSVCGLSELGFDEDDAVVMQWIGLKDMNGVEIYEGDIVIQREKDSEDDVETTRGVIEFKPPQFSLKFREGAYLGLRNFGDRYREYKLGIEVIGNIYENKELLNEKN